MAILIKGMEMPKRCGECPLSLYPHSPCWENGGALDWENRPNWCPLVEIPPHGRLGDLDKLEQMFADIDHAPYCGFDGEDPFYSAADAAQIIRLAPTIIPASFENLPKSKDSQKIEEGET